jgi:hypothetical protein
MYLQVNNFRPALATFHRTYLDDHFGLASSQIGLSE